MLKKYRYKIIKVLVLLILGFNTLDLSAQEKYNSDLDWKNIETDNFIIHFHQGTRKIAFRLGVIAEEVHNNLISQVHWKPKSKTHVILIDSTDMANGYAIMIPHNRVQIYLSRPELDMVLHNFDDWLRMVFTHEYAHVLNLDSVRWIGSGLRSVFGRNIITFPNLFVPTFMLEGNAVYHESRRTKFGRVNSTYANMVLRTEILTNKFKSIDQASTFPRSWPKGNVPYLYGGFFVDYLEKKYGSGSFAKVFDENSENCMPFSDHIYLAKFYNKDVKDVYGKSFPVLWDEFKGYAENKYLLQIKNIKKSKLTKYIIISDIENNSILPRFSSNNSNDIYYVKHSSANGSHLVKYNLKKKKRENICRVKYPQSYAVAKNLNIYLSDIELYNSMENYNEAFIYDDGLEQITSKLRGKSFDLDRNKNKIIYIKNNLDKYSLIESDTSFENITYLLKEIDLQITDARISFDNKKIVFIVKNRNGSSDLVLYNRISRQFKKLTGSKYNNINAAWHPDNNRIVFVSDRSGIFNLYEYDLNKNQINRLSNVLTGAFHPDISKDGKKIVFSLYNKNGKTITLMKYPAQKYESFKNTQRKIDISYFNQKRKEDMTGQTRSDYVVKDYSFLDTVFPTSWFPVFYSEQISQEKYDTHLGIFIFGTDILYRHKYYVMTDYAPKQDRLSVNATYTYSRFYPDFYISYYDNAILLKEDKFPFDDVYKEKFTRKMTRIGSLGVSIPYYKLRYQHNLQLSYLFEKEYRDSYIQGATPAEDIITSSEENMARGQAIYQFNNANWYTYSISKEDGVDFLLIGDYYHKRYESKKKEIVLGTDNDFYKVRGEFNAYIPSIFDNNLFRLRMRGGLSQGNYEKQPYTLGRFVKGETGLFAQNEDAWGVRGYPAKVLTGNKLATATLEYKFPLIQADFGIYTFPLMFRDLWINIFAEAGSVWYGDLREKGRLVEQIDNKFRKEFIRKSAGIELHTRFSIFYHLDLFAYAGYAKGFDKLGEHQIYFAVGTLLGGIEGAKDQNKLKKIQSF